MTNYFFFEKKQKEKERGKWMMEYYNIENRESKGIIIK